MNLLYYVSGHGYGHAVRSAEIIAAIHRRRPDAHVFVRTTAPAFLFGRDDGPTPEVSHASLDSGAIENGIFDVNAEATVSRLRALIHNREAILKQEHAWVKAHDVALIVADIPWLAGDIAQTCGIPCIGISNFLWSWIYEPFLIGHNDAGLFESELIASYEKFTLILRLPLAHSMDQLRCVRDVPLVASRSHRDQGELLQAIGCRPNDSRTRVVVSLRDTDSIEAISRIAPSQPDVLFLLPGARSADVLLNLRTIETGSAIKLSDLVAIGDVVLAKPGYGIISACAANRVRLLCLPRNGFREDEVLLREGRQLIPIEMLPHEEFRNGTWGNRLRTLLDSSISSLQIDLNGADVCAQIISTY